MVKNNDFSYSLQVDENEYLKKKESMTSFFLDISYVPMTFKQIANLLNVRKEYFDLLRNIIYELEQDGIIVEDSSKRYVLLSKTNLLKCKFESKGEKFGFGITDDNNDIFIPIKDSMGAYSGDEILVKVTKDNKTRNKSREGIVVKILKRNTTRVIGKFIKSRNFGFVEPLYNKSMHIYIPKKYATNIANEKIVEVEILKYATSSSKAEGKIINVIGDSRNDKTYVDALYTEYGLDVQVKFNKLVEKELEKIPDNINPNDKLGRIDRTKEKVFTIDSEDAMDLDDGVFVKKNTDGNYILSVYIADVSNYVKNGTALDNEAISRGTSVYIPGTVIPMLPKKLSNGICSLNEGVERLALAIDMTIDKRGNVIDENIFKSVIKVTKKMSYNKVYKVIKRQDDEVLQEYKDYIEDIDLMLELAKILNKKRLDNGSINFDIPETKIVLDDNGNVLDVRPYEITIANNIIEEFMLIANMTIAKKFYFLDIPFIYRIHEKPDEEKLRQLNEILSCYHKRIKINNGLRPKVLSSILEEIEDENEKRIISTFMLRSLKVAKYSEICEEHFGLAAKYYCHFTSPIRRYPDLFIHRVISDYLESGYSLEDEKILMYSNQAAKYAYTSSEREKEATKIERDFDDLYKVLYMKEQIGKEFEGRISSITSFGIFVELDNTIEGFVGFDSLPGNEYYEYDESKRILIGRKTSKVYRIGDNVKIKNIKCDTSLKQIDFEIIK